METADKEALQGYPIGARLGAGLVLEKGDTVWLVTDREKELGTIKLVDGGRYFVRWSNGRTWIYPSCDLVLGLTQDRAKELDLI